MQLTDRDLKFVRRRQRLTSCWTLAGSGLLCAIGGFVIYLFLNARWLVDPWFVLEQISAGEIAASTLQTMALILPVVFLTCLFLLLVMIILAFAAFSNERRLLKLIPGVSDKR